MTYLWPDGDTIQVTTTLSGQPEHVIWNGRLHPIQVILNRWTLDDNWWLQHIWRDYYEVTTTTGLLLVIFQDLLTDEWFIQRLYD